MVSDPKIKNTFLPTCTSPLVTPITCSHHLQLLQFLTAIKLVYLLDGIAKRPKYQLGLTELIIPPPLKYAFLCVVLCY